MANESGLDCRNGATLEAEMVRPYYQAIGREEATFKAAYRRVRYCFGAIRSPWTPPRCRRTGG